MNICDRSARAQHAILASLSPSPACASVSTAQMASITALTVTSGGASVQLQSGDFADMSNLQSLDLRNNGIRVLPEHLLNGVPAMFRRLDIRGNPVTRIPLQVLADWDDGASNEALFVDPEDRIAGFQYRVDGTTVSRLVLFEDHRIAALRGVGFQVVLPPAFPQLSVRLFSASRSELNSLEGEVGLLRDRFTVPNRIIGTVTVHDRSISWKPDEDFAEETTERTLVWEWADNRVYLSEGNSHRLRVEGFPVEVRESLVLRDDDTRPNRIEAGSPDGSPVTGWRALALPSASAAVASDLGYEYALVSDAGGLFTINTANGALLLASGQSLNTPGTHHVVVMATATGPHLALATTAQAAIEVVVGVNICARTEAARRAILAATQDEDLCSMVRRSQLAAIMALAITGGNVRLQAEDFADMPNLQALDLRNNGIRVLPERLLGDVPGIFRRLDIRDNPVTRIPVQVLADWDDGDTDQALFVDPEDRIAGFQYRADGTSLSRLVLLEDDQAATRSSTFQVVLPPAFPQLSVRSRSFSASRSELNPLEGEMGLPADRFTVPGIFGSDTAQDKSIIWTPDEDFAEETTERTLVWEWNDNRVYWSEGNPHRLRVEAFPVEVRESLVLRDDDTRPNRIEAGSPDGLPVTGWRAQAVPSASTAVAASLDYEYALVSDAGGLFTINTANGALLLAPGQPHLPGTHHVVVMATAAGPRLALATTAQAAIEVIAGVNICARTEAVRTAILAATADEDLCSVVRRSQLAAITALAITGNNVLRLQAGDFAGLPNLQSLVITDNNFLQLQAGDFAGLPNLQSLDLRNNGIRVLPERLLDGVPAVFHHLDIRGNPFTRIPVRVLAEWDNSTDTNRALLVDEEDRLAGVQYRLADGTTLSRLVLIEDNRITRSRNFDFQVVLPDGISQLSVKTFFAVGPALNPPGGMITLNPPSGIAGTATVEDKSISWTPDGDFTQERVRRVLMWAWRGSGVRRREGDIFSLAVEAFPVEVRESFALGDDNPATNRVAAGAPAGSPVIGWQPQPMPSAGAEVAAGLDYEYALVSDAGGLFTINTANGALSLASARLPPAMPSSHHLTVMAAVDGPDFTLTATAEVTVVQDDDLWHICDRTPAVQRAILAAKGGGDCALVAGPLTFGLLAVTGSVATLKRGDFRGVSVIDSLGGSLQLLNLGLESLSADVFEGAGVMYGIDISRNNISSLPADVFSRLPVGLCQTILHRNPLTRLPIRLLTGLKRIAPVVPARPRCVMTRQAHLLIEGGQDVDTDGDGQLNTEHTPTPDYLGNIRYIDADTGGVVSSGFAVTEGERRRIQIELDALPGVNGRFVLNDNQGGVSDPLSLEPASPTFTSFSEKTRIEVTVTARTDDNREHETVSLFWRDMSDDGYYEGTASGARLSVRGYDGDRSTGGINSIPLPLITPPLLVRILEPVGIEDTDPEPNRIWSGSPPGTGVAGWAPRVLVDGAVSAETSWSLVSGAGGLFAIDTASGALSARGNWPLSSTGQRSIVVGADYRGAPATHTAAIEVFGALSLEDADVAQNAATVGDATGTRVRGIMPLVRADDAVVADGIAWTLTGGGGLFRVDTSSGAILLTRQLTATDVNVWTVTQTASYLGAAASLPLPVVVSLSDRVNICDRTPVVQTAILAETPAADTCDSVLLTEMAELTRLSVTATDAVATLSDLDFRRMPRLRTLNLNNLGLTSLPSAIFRSTTDLEVLRLHDNHDLNALPVQLLADLRNLHLLRVEAHIRVGGIRYRVNGEATTGTLVVSEDESRDVLVEATGGLHTTLTLTFQAQGAPVSATPAVIELGPSAGARSVRLSAAADADIVHDRSSVAWKWELFPPQDKAGVRRGEGRASDIPTPDLAVRVNETVALTDTNPAANRLREDAADDVEVAGWSPLVTAGGIAVPTTAVSYRLTADAGGLFEVNSATGALSLADGRLPDYAVSSRHTVTVEADYDGVAASRPVTIDVIDVTDICSRTDAVENAILAATPADDACGSVLASELRAITALTATAAAVSVTEADFGGLPNLEHLDLTATGAVRLPVQIVANLARLARLRVDRRARISGLVYRDDGSGEVITPPLVLREGVPRTLRVGTTGVLGRVLRFALDGSGLREVTSTDSHLELGSPSTPTLELTALTDEDFNPVTGVLAWVLEPGSLQVQAPAGAEFVLHTLRTEGLRVEVREADVFEDADPADNRISEAAPVNTVVSGWSPQVLVNGVQTTAVRYRLADDAGGLFGIDSATGALSLAGELDYEASTFHAVGVAARVMNTGVTASLSAVIRVDNVPELSFSGVVTGVISEAAAAGAAVSGVAVSLLDDGVSRADESIVYELTGEGSEAFAVSVAGNVAGLQLANHPLDRETTPAYSLMLSGRYLGASISTRVSVRVANVVEEVVLEAAPEVYRIDEDASSGTVVGVTLTVKTEDRVTRTDGVRYALTGSGSFRITTGGDIVVLGALDYEATTSHQLTITAAYGGVTSSEVNIAVHVQNVVETVSLVVSETMHRFAEGTVSGTSVDAMLTVKTEDGVTRTDGVVYALTGSESFRITTGGELFVADTLDYEETTSHTLTITAAWEGVTSNEVDVIVHVGDLSLSLPGTATGVITENVAPDTAVSGVGVAVLFGETAITALADLELSGTGSEVFRITTDEGIVRLRLAVAELDREAASIYMLSLRASHLGESVSTQITVHVANVVEEVTLETGAAPGTARNYNVNEGAAPGTPLGAMLVVKTEDGVTRTDGVVYGISLSAAPFIVTGGEIFVTGPLDAESVRAYTFEITATYEGVRSDPVFVVVNVRNLSLSLSGTAVGAIAENAATGTVVTGVEISALFGEAEVTTAAALALSGTGAETFRITTDTGVARLRLSDAQLDHETTRTYTLTLTATWLSDESASTPITVNVQNLVESVSLEVGETVYHLAEGTVSGTSIGAMPVVKTEDGVARTDGVSYALTGSVAFRITTGGDILVSGTLDYEQTTSHTLMITATYEGVTSDEARVTVNVEDLSLSLSGTVIGSIAEDALPDTVVTGVEISALFGETTVTTAAAWALSGTGAETFRVTTDTGVARLQLSNAELDYGATPTYTLSLRASWLGETAAVPVTVSVADVNRLIIELTGNPPHIVTETAPPGVRIGDARLTARTDGDGITRTGEVDWRISPAAGLFRIASTGAVIVAGALDYETSTLHTLTITASWQSMTSNEERLVILVADVERDPQLVDLNITPNTALNTTDARVAGLNLAFLTDGVEQTSNVEWIFAPATPARTETAFTIDPTTGVIRLNNPITATLPQTYEATVTATQTDRTASLPLSIRVVSGLAVRIRVFLEGAVIP